MVRSTLFVYLHEPNIPDSRSPLAGPYGLEILLLVRESSGAHYPFDMVDRIDRVGRASSEVPNHGTLEQNTDSRDS
jgi:hypothetical protein